MKTIRFYWKTRGFRIEHRVTGVVSQVKFIVFPISFTAYTMKIHMNNENMYSSAQCEAFYL